MSRIWISGLVVILCVLPWPACSQSLPSVARPCLLEFNVGYVTNGGMTELLLRRYDSLSGWYVDYNPTHALYLDVGLPIDLGKLGTFRLTGSLALPASWKIETIEFPQGTHQRNWTGDTTWGTLEGRLDYPIGGGFSALAGFRWDTWQTSITNPVDYTSSRYFPTDTSDVTVNGYLPLLGLMYSMGGLELGVLGFPAFLGDMELYEGTREGLRREHVTDTYGEGHYIEIFMEWALPTNLLADGSDFDAAFFVKFNSVRALGPGQRTNLPSTDSEAYPTRFDRKLFVMGFNATVNFNLPDIGGLL